MDVGMSGGDKLQKYIYDLQVKLGQDAKEVHVGFLEGSTAGYNGPRPMKKKSSYKTSAGFARGKAAYVLATNSNQGSEQPAAYIASIHEYGDPKHNIPSRPFFSTMIAKNSPTWGKLLAKCLKAQGYYARPALEELGLVVSEQLVSSIVTGPWAATKPATQARKGFETDTPLLDSKNMMRAVSFVVI